MIVPVQAHDRKPAARRASWDTYRLFVHVEDAGLAISRQIAGIRPVHPVESFTATQHDSGPQGVYVVFQCQRRQIGCFMSPEDFAAWSRDSSCQLLQHN